MAHKQPPIWPVPAAVNAMADRAATAGMTGARVVGDRCSAFLKLKIAGCEPEMLPLRDRHRCALRLKGDHIGGEERGACEERRDGEDACCHHVGSSFTMTQWNHDSSGY